MERKLSVNFRGFRIIVVEALEDMRRDYVSRIMARDHNYLFNLNFCEIALYDKLFFSFRGPIVAGLDYVEPRPPATVESGREGDTIRSGEYGVGFSERAAVLSAGGWVRRGLAAR